LPFVVIVVPALLWPSMATSTVAELTDIGTGIGRPVRQRTTTYGVPTRTELRLA
jgi:hypothetical protein